MSEPQIDAVITWVDGNDPSWQNKINKYSDTPIDFDNKKNSIRFNSIGEIDIAIKSIIKFASFVRNVFLVTDEQTPEHFTSLRLLAKENNIQLILIDHKEVFKGYEHYLPCFNSCSIESVLHQIPDLSDHFILFNDDMFLMRETKPTDFFRNNHPVIRGKWEKFREQQIFRNTYDKLRSISRSAPLPVKGGFKSLQQEAAKLAGTGKYVRRFHTPAAIRKTTLVDYFEKNELLLAGNLQHRFRIPGQFIISSLAEHLDIKNKTYTFKRQTQLTYFRSYKGLLHSKIKLQIFAMNPKKIFMTFQSLELADDKTQSYIFKWIDKRLNHPS